ncbi:hypothetical protein [Chryseobacterium sp.]|uniref:hypothetical protein n=1 Tax=Chryseobacterium sp. TaxID=1871047 RepID=UPI0025B906D8|nr:hypothetical protein [Chryseobacterium sp.]MBV8326900.1 hypothetical protein [Chryseobacterium sp.]
MKLYNYWAFSIYKLLKIGFKKDDRSILIHKTALVVSFLLFLILCSLKFFSELNGYDDTVISNLYLFGIMCVIWLFNYLYLRKGTFIKDDFFFNYTNIIVAVISIVGVFILFMITADKSRERIFKKRGYSQEIIDNGGAEPFDPDKKPASLEDEIRLWYHYRWEGKDKANR